jgi:MHS family proline/betaine transporter-like MFS transporter
MGIAYNFAVAIFGGTTPFIIAALIAGTGNDMMPAYYLMLTSFIGGISIFWLKESANRPLPGSMPSVESDEEARELVAGQDDNPLLDTDEMPFDASYEPPTSSMDLTALNPGSGAEPTKV